MSIHIIGNGRSRSLFKNEDANDNDLIIGCNLPSENIKHDYIAAVDSSAITNLYRPVTGSHHHYLTEKKFKFILGPRCVKGLSVVKARAGDNVTLLEYLKNGDYVECVIDNTSLIEQAQIGQRYFSSGHLGFQYASNYHRGEIIHLYGFDSLFTGFHDSYTADYIYRTDSSRLKSKYNPEEPSNTAISWYVIWHKLMHYYLDNYMKVYIHGPEDAGKHIPSFFKHLKTEYIGHM